MSPHGRSKRQRLAKRLANDSTPGSVSASTEVLRALTLEIGQAQADGKSPRTLSKDRLAWDHFCEYGRQLGFDPNLCTVCTRRFPERETFKLAGFILYTAQQMPPRPNKHKVA